MIAGVESMTAPIERFRTAAMIALASADAGQAHQRRERRGVRGGEGHEIAAGVGGVEIPRGSRLAHAPPKSAGPRAAEENFQPVGCDESATGLYIRNDASWASMPGTATPVVTIMLLR